MGIVVKLHRDLAEMAQGEGFANPVTELPKDREALLLAVPRLRRVPRLEVDYPQRGQGTGNLKHISQTLANGEAFCEQPRSFLLVGLTGGQRAADIERVATR